MLRDQWLPATNSRTAKLVHRRTTIVAFLSEPVKSKSTYVDGYILSLVRDLRIAQGIISTRVSCFGLSFSLLVICAYLTAKYSMFLITQWYIAQALVKNRLRISGKSISIIRCLQRILFKLIHNIPYTKASQMKILYKSN